MKRVLKRGLAGLLLIAFTAFAWAFFSPRPPLTIDPETLAGEGAALNYCTLPDLNGQGLRAEDIPKGNTPGCAYDHFPLPILRDCREPLTPGAADLRGLWQAVSGKLGHVERIEQCGRRVVITTAGLIHDGGPNATAGESTNDTEGSVLFTLGSQAFCARTSATMTWDEGILNFHAFGWGPLVVRRYLEGEAIIWEYADGSITRMERICALPEAHRTPQPRGLRLKLL